MNKNVSSEDNFNSLNVLYFIYKWRKQLILIGITSLAISSLISLTIQEKYKSTVILFPVATSSISQTLLTENNFKHGDLLQFGAAEEAEQMLQILNSDEVRSRICEKYNLMVHYGIKKDNKFKNTKLYEEFLNNITFKRTEYLSVKIEVMDHNADTAALIANDIAALHDSTKNHMQQQRAEQALKIVETEYLNKLAEVKGMSDSIKVLNGYGLYDYESQSEVTTEQYAIAISKGDQRAIKSLETKLKIIADYGSTYVSIRDNIELQRKQLNILKTKYEQAKVDVNQVLSQKFIVSNAYPAEKKSYPICWIIVTISVIGSLLIALITILIIENIKQMNSKKIIH